MLAAFQFQFAAAILESFTFLRPCPEAKLGIDFLQAGVNALAFGLGITRISRGSLRHKPYSECQYDNPQELHGDKPVVRLWV